MGKTTLLLVVPPKLKELKEEIQNIVSYNNAPVFIQVTMFNDLKLLNGYIETDTNDHDVMMIFESITNSRANIEKAQSELLEDIRKIKVRSLNTKIIVILQEEKEKDLIFINELIKLDVQDFYFTSSFSKDDLAEWIFAGQRTLKENLKYVSTEIKRPEKEIITKEVTKYIEVPAEVPDTQGKKGFFNKELIKQQPQPEKIKLNKMIGIIGMCSGAGATSLCVKCAEFLKEENYKVLLLDRTENRNLSSLKMKGQEILSCDLSNVNISQYDYILIDFGTLADIQDGKVLLKPDMNNEKRIERSFCHKTILVGSTLPWKLKELYAYIDNDVFKHLTKEWIFYLNGEENAPFNILRKSIEEERTAIASYEHDNPILELKQYI